MSYRSAYPLSPPPSASEEPTEDCATDWPDWGDGSDGPTPIHLDTCWVMTGDDTYCTCGLTLLIAAGARFLR